MEADLFNPNELVVISGGTGWIGRSLVENIIRTRYCPIDSIVLISSQIKKIKISNTSVQTQTWDNLAINSKVCLYFDFAFQPQDKLKSLGEMEFVKQNETIIQNSVNFIKDHKPTNIFLASSGAVYGKNYSSTPKPLSIYGKLKFIQESKISKISKDENLNLIISRVFNLSGSNINKFQTFAITQMIRNAVDKEGIKVLADHQVFRRYADVNQFIRLALKLSDSHFNGIFDSGGPLIELRDLASEIKKIINPLAKLELNKIKENVPIDDYYSRSNQYENLLKQYLDEVPIKIEDQILTTFHYMTGVTN